MNERDVRSRMAFILSIDNIVRSQLFGELPDDDEYRDLREDLLEDAFDPRHPHAAYLKQKMEAYVIRKKEEVAPKPPAKKTPRRKKKQGP